MLNKDEKRISFIDIRLTNGGSGRVLSILANYFAKKNWQVSIITLDDYSVDYALDEHISFHNLRMEKGRNLFDLFKKSLELKRLLSNQDVIIAFCFRPIFWVTLVTMTSRSKVIYSERNDPYNDPTSELKRKLRNLCYYRADRLVFQTSDQKDYFSKSIAQRSVIIKNPISENLPLYDDKKHEKIIITACRLEKQKNIPVGIRAFSIFHKAHPDYQYHIYGEGALKEELEKLINELGLSDSVIIYKFAKNIHEIMCNSSIFILSSDYEGISNSMLEAMAMGMPVICTDCPIGGARETIKNEVNGVLVPVGDYKMMAEYMSKIVEDDDFRMKIEKNAYGIREEIKTEEICGEWSEVVRSITD